MFEEHKYTLIMGAIWFAVMLFYHMGKFNKEHRERKLIEEMMKKDLEEKQKETERNQNG